MFIIGCKVRFLSLPVLMFMFLKFFGDEGKKRNIVYPFKGDSRVIDGRRKETRFVCTLLLQLNERSLSLSLL